MKMWQNLLMRIKLIQKKKKLEKLLKHLIEIERWGNQLREVRRWGKWGRLQPGQNINISMRNLTPPQAPLLVTPLISPCGHHLAHSLSRGPVFSHFFPCTTFEKVFLSVFFKLTSCHWYTEVTMTGGKANKPSSHGGKVEMCPTPDLTLCPWVQKQKNQIKYLRFLQSLTNRYFSLILLFLRYVILKLTPLSRICAFCLVWSSLDVAPAGTAKLCAKQLDRVFTYEQQDLQFRTGTGPQPTHS